MDMITPTSDQMEAAAKKAVSARLAVLGIKKNDSKTEYAYNHLVNSTIQAASHMLQAPYDVDKLHCAYTTDNSEVNKLSELLASFGAKIIPPFISQPESATVFTEYFGEVKKHSLNNVVLSLKNTALKAAALEPVTAAVKKWANDNGISEEKTPHAWEHLVDGAISSANTYIQGAYPKDLMGTYMARAYTHHRAKEVFVPTADAITKFATDFNARFRSDEDGHKDPVMEGEGKDFSPVEQSIVARANIIALEAAADTLGVSRRELEAPSLTANPWARK